MSTDSPNSPNPSNLDSTQQQNVQQQQQNAQQQNVVPHPALPGAIQQNMNDLTSAIQEMKSAIQKVRDTRKVLHDNTAQWVNNNIKVALSTEQTDAAS